MTRIVTVPKTAVDYVDMQAIEDAQELGFLPKDTLQSPVLLEKLIREVPASVFAQFVIKPSDLKSGDVKQGMLDSRPHEVQLGRTTLTNYAGIPAVIKVWEKPELAKKFVDFENANPGRDPHWTNQVL